MTDACSNLTDACSELILLAPLLLFIILFFSGYEQELSDVLPKWKKPMVEGRDLSRSGFGE